MGREVGRIGEALKRIRHRVRRGGIVRRLGLVGRFGEREIVLRLLGLEGAGGLDSFQFTLGATNVFNRVPPYANYASSANNFIGGYDISYGDPRGRFVYATISYTLQH